MFLYFKKEKFRNHIRKCGILEDKEVRTKAWLRDDLNYIYRGLEEWEQDILNEEINRVEREKKEKKMKKEMEENRKVFFDKWKND
jgi:ribosome-binding ATPase YchF (GTP1/OBG family)